MSKKISPTESNKIDGKIKSYGDYFQEYSDKFSNACRQLAFAEGGVFWILKPETPELPFIILFGLGALVSYFLFDLLQYYIGMEGYRSLFLESQKKLNHDSKLKSSMIQDEKLKSKIDLCYYPKVIFIITSSILLGTQFVSSFLCRV